MDLVVRSWDEYIEALRHIYGQSHPMPLCIDGHEYRRRQRRRTKRKRRR